jgi:phosphomannomutase|tara:strand:+ start:1329 stop:2021 length:693 start_codon:yes stop_codon:yes gene_type:complete
MMFVFDVDGTLTPSRKEMNNVFKWWFQENIQNYCFVTGSDRDKTIEQVGLDMFVGAKYSFNCNGNDVNFYGAQIHTNDWTLPVTARNWLDEKLEQSEFVLRTGNHIEERPGMVNFSIVGRNATMGERKLYVEYDTKLNERNTITEMFNEAFPELDAKAGGETGIDIGPKGSDKSQVIKFIDDEELVFFGDRMDPLGNDYPLSKIILDNSLGKCYNVKDYNETWELLKQYV